VKGVGRPGYIYLKPDSYTHTPPGEEIKLKKQNKVEKLKLCSSF
jgi:hypothetical protein